MQQNTRQVQKNAGPLWTPLPSPSSASHEDCRPFHFILSVSHTTPFLKSCCPPNSDSSGLSLYHGLRSRHLHTSVSRYLKRCLSNIDDLFWLPCESFILATNATIHLSERLLRHSFPPYPPRQPLWHAPSFQGVPCSQPLLYKHSLSPEHPHFLSGLLQWFSKKVSCLKS